VVSELLVKVCVRMVRPRHDALPPYHPPDVQFVDIKIQVVQIWLIRQSSIPTQSASGLLHNSSGMRCFGTEIDQMRALFVLQVAIPFSTRFLIRHGNAMFMKVRSERSIKSVLKMVIFGLIKMSFPQHVFLHCH